MILDETGCPADRLELEVTENLVLDRSVHVREQLARLQRMGISIVLDDFGTGYSSLSYLCQFSFDKIKIDQEFIRGAGSSPRAHGILRTIAALTRRFDIEVTAEGVETGAHATLVRSLRIPYAQGFLFSRPVPEAEVADLFMRDYARQVAEEVRKLPSHRPHLVVVGK
jgi:EAL domain-containing protein (putative c-di-GMP-specific phosphodiesterase class I)